MKPVFTDKAPAAIGPYSQAIEANGFIFVSGQLGMDPVSGEIAQGLENQAHQSLKNMQAILKAAGSDLSKVVKTTIFVTNMADFAKVNEIYASYFEGHRPARATVGVAALPKGGIVEVECVAIQ